MAAKVVWYRSAWWVRTHADGQKRDRKVGPTKADKRQAQKIAEKINAALALGQYRKGSDDQAPLRCDDQGRRWHRTYGPAMKPTYEASTRGLIENHMAPHFGSRDLREIREADILGFARAKLEHGLSPGTIRNALAVVRRVFYLLQREGLVDRNPAARIGDLMRSVDRRISDEVREVEAWNRSEVQQLLDMASEHEPRLHPALLFLFSTGVRRGEMLGLKWEDIDFDRREITIRRSITARRVSTPKSGRSRKVAMAGRRFSCTQR